MAWFAIASAGLVLLIDHSTAPGVGAVGPPHWPLESAIHARPDVANLVVVLHPRCPCSAATVDELDRLMASGAERVAAHVVIVEPSGAPADFADTGLVAAAARIPGVEIVRDPDGREAAIFGAVTSGQTFLYSRDGERLFAGGITPGRGHEGSNAGGAAILAALDGVAERQSYTAVFGCSLVDPARSPQRTSIIDRLRSSSAASWPSRG